MSIDTRKRILFVYSNLGIGGISKSLIELLKLIDYATYNVTLLIRRDDVLDLIQEIPSSVETITTNNSVKNLEFDSTLSGKIVRFLYAHLLKRHAFLAKKLFEAYRRPIQRKREETIFAKKGYQWDVAFSYSTDDDMPIFVKENINAKHKYVVIHQSTKIARQNVKALKSYTGVIVVNPALVSWVEALVKKKVPVWSIENYVSYEKIRVLSKETTLTVKGKTVLATCGRICLTKGYDYVVETANLLKKNGLSFIWYWIGDGPERTKMEEMIELYDLNDSIIITGFTDNPFPYLDACQLYLQPSRAEAYPLSVLEAIVLCKPIICTRTAGTDYICEKYHCGYPVNSSSESIAEKIFELLSNPDLMLKETQKLFDIDWEKEKKEYIHQYNDIIEMDYFHE